MSCLSVSHKSMSGSLLDFMPKQGDEFANLENFTLDDLTYHTNGYVLNRIYICDYLEFLRKKYLCFEKNDRRSFVLENLKTRLLKNYAAYEARGDLEKIQKRRFNFHVILETAASSDQPSSGGPCGWATRLSVKDKHQSKVLKGGFASSSVYRVRIFAILMGLKSLKEPCRVDIILNNTAILEIIERLGPYSFQSCRESLRNLDLYTEMQTFLKIHDLNVLYRKEEKDKNFCLQLAKEEWKKPDLPKDTGFSYKTE